MSALAVVPEVGVAPPPYDLTTKLPSSLKQVGTRRDYQMIDPRLIDIEPGFNARDYTLPENRAHLDRLKVLIAKDGVQQPITARLNRETGRATVVNGECRLRAVLELIAEGHEVLSMADMPCYPAPAGSEDPIKRRFASLNANEGKPFSMWELGRGYQDLFDQNVSVQKIAEGTANTVAFVKEAMELASAPDEVKQLLSSQAVTPAEAKRVIRSVDVPAAVSELQATVQAKKAKGEKGPVKRPKAATPKAAKDDTKNVSNLVLYAAEELAKAVDVWIEDATVDMEIKLIAAHKAYRKLIPAPRQAKAA